MQLHNKISKQKWIRLDLCNLLSGINSKNLLFGGICEMFKTLVDHPRDAMNGHRCVE